MNKVILVGRITDLPTAGTTSNQTEYSRFTLAVDRRAYGQNQPLTDFIPCVAWRNNANFINKFLTKGSLLLVEGSLQVSRSLYNGASVLNYSVNVENIQSLESKEVTESRRNKNANMTSNSNAGINIPPVNQNSKNLNSKTNQEFSESEITEVSSPNSSGDWDNIFDDFEI
ncbi:single-stranded DNA-binding protein [[Mycoplasma] gypis]|uniref:Single-stranded DNA-binding protein n=1 Tax=[Mycoplasma] gypis TaxID=92404 RepID=A0ABZ2RMI1_9BACT|nr:single-stranded DNA-binding protein [[Mycoplasma] gypis]MBN0919096.1 single-stranded DNA-binding protein [[Mycoplasma] gypis]